MLVFLCFVSLANFESFDVGFIAGFDVGFVVLFCRFCCFGYFDWMLLLEERFTQKMFRNHLRAVRRAEEQRPMLVV